MTTEEPQPAKVLSPQDRLSEIAERLKRGEKVDPISVRDFLWWFWAQRRTVGTVSWVRHNLAQAQLQTQPDFQYVWLDAPIEFALSDEKKVPTDEGAITASLNIVIADPTYRIGKLPSANKTPLSVTPNSTISEAVTLMLSYDYSQLPVMTGERDVKGVISWTSIGSRFALGVQCKEVRHCMENANIISSDVSLFDAIDLIVRNQYVLVADGTKKISGIITTSDLSLQFRQLAEPFLLLGEIENHIRGIIEKAKFSSDELKSCKDPNDTGRSVSDVSELTLGECRRLLEVPSNWPRTQLAIDRSVFGERLGEVCRIRNEVMHFDPDGISPDDLANLREFVNFLQRLQLIIRAQ